MSAMLRSWKQWAATAERPSHDQSLPEDRPLLDALGGAREVVRWSSWEKCRDEFNPWSRQTPLHTGLVPLPYVGDVRRSKVFFLLLNPGLSATDYYAEYKAPGFRARLLANLRQDFEGTRYPFFPLDPALAWHSGNAYWQGKLKHIVLELCTRANREPAEVRRFLAQRVCAIEMLPYHSVRLNMPNLQEFPSGKLAREFVRRLVPRAQTGACMLVAMRQVDAWNVPLDCEHILRFESGESQGAHLSTKADDAKGSLVADFLQPLLARRRWT